jgi:hypothetical protein
MPKSSKGGSEMLNWLCVNHSVSQHFPCRGELHDICKALRVDAIETAVGHHFSSSSAHLGAQTLDQSFVSRPSQTDGQLQHGIEF